MRILTHHRDSPGNTGSPGRVCELVQISAEGGEDLAVLTAFVRLVGTDPGTVHAALRRLIEQAGGPGRIPTPISPPTETPS